MQKAQAELDKKVDDVQVELQKQFNAVLNGQRRLSALEVSVKSAELLIEATRKSITGGTRTNLDALNAERQLFEAKRDLALARYNYLQSYINLRKAAGTLGLSDLQNVAAYFQGS
jgi:protease secretion system outer membrane protein